MSLVERKIARGLMGLAAMGAALAAGGVAQAQSVVLRATGPSSAGYPAGKKLPANTEIVLKSGDVVTVLDKAGTRVLRGPGTITLDGAVVRDRTGSKRVADLVSGSAGARARTGAVRGAGSGAASATHTGPTSIWQIDTTKGGTWCVADASMLVFWRPDRVEALSGKVSGQNSSAEVAFKRGSALKLWPQEMPIVDGATYTFEMPGASPATLITRVLPGVPQDDIPAVYSMLNDAGCTAQRDLLAQAAFADAEEMGEEAGTTDASAAGGAE
ncbi:hypothetical protein [Croceicoccus bisphenolivorans]|uniref:hypothetical protein n=1 Tax=Croceicoccus bisphenolivorans TaxID=1783232 RepID=UPI0012E7CB69|nr:hypothetical protein [Croceicoccus bisphenolivorans]